MGGFELGLAFQDEFSQKHTQRGGFGANYFVKELFLMSDSKGEGEIGQDKQKWNLK